MTNTAVRKALPADVPILHGLIARAAETTPVIARSQAALYETIRDFYVFDEGKGITGCCALAVTWGDLAEIKSLSVDPSMQGRGLGRILVEACLQEARELGIPRVFALTAAVAFFKRVGFHEIDMNDLPHKVWGDCINCPKYPDCDEVAVQIDLQT
jgi:amino-acid N-acetyltransferase